jgi:hypothetical protein
MEDNSIMQFEDSITAIVFHKPLTVPKAATRRSILLCNLLHNNIAGCPQTVQYFCAIIQFKSDPSVANKLSDTEASCLAIALAVCLKKEEKKRRWMKEWLKKRNEYTHENLLKDLRIKYLNQLIFNSIRKSLSVFAKQMFVFFFFSPHSVAVILALDIPQRR